MQSVKEKLFKIVQTLFGWCLIRVYLYIPFLRPKHIRFGKHVKLGLWTRIKIDKKSQLEIGDNCKLNRVNLLSVNSTIKIGNGAEISRNVVSCNDSVIQIGDYLLVNKWNLYLNDSTLTALDYLKLSRITPYYGGLHASNAIMTFGLNVNISAKITCSGSSFSVGDNSFINQGTEIRCYNSIDIGEYVLISYECLIFDTNTHSVDADMRKKEIENGFPHGTVQLQDQLPKTGPIAIGDQVWLGMRVVIFKNTYLGAKSIVGTNAVVSNLKVPEDSLVIGNPAIIKS